MLLFTSDTHFGMERTLKLSRRPFKSVKQMDKVLIKNWNKKVAKGDTVYHLGDFGNKNIVKKLHGKVILILGNYEERELKEQYNNNFDAYKSYLIDLGFYDVIRHDLTLTFNDEQYYLTHKPLDCKSNMFNLFGHIHGQQKVKEFGYDVGVDANFFYPCTLDDVFFWQNSVKIHLKGKSVFCNLNDIKNNENSN